MVIDHFVHHFFSWYSTTFHCFPGDQYRFVLKSNTYDDVIFSNAYTNKRKHKYNTKMLCIFWVNEHKKREARNYWPPQKLSPALVAMYNTSYTSQFFISGFTHLMTRMLTNNTVNIQNIRRTCPAIRNDFQPCYVFVRNTRLSINNTQLYRELC